MSEIIIDGWKCSETYEGQPWRTRTATNKRGDVEFTADSDGLQVSENHTGYMGASGSYGISANVFMWLAQAVRL